MKNTPKRILVVDDTLAMRDLVAKIVENLGYCVSVAGDGKKALNSLKSNGEVDAVITDYNMPMMNGEELTLWIKRNRPGVPVIFTSAQNLEDFREVAEAAGADEVLDKREIVAKLPAILNDLIGSPNPLGL